MKAQENCWNSFLTKIIFYSFSVRVIRNKPGYFAQKMQKAMKGLGTDDSALVRVIVTRCECDMVQIKDAFNVQAKGTLADWIKVSASQYKPRQVVCGK